MNAAELALILQEARYGTDCPVSGDFDAAVRDAILAGYRAGMRDASPYAGALQGALHRVKYELGNYADVIDGHEGKQHPNLAMELETLLLPYIDAALAKNPNPSGRASPEASVAYTSEASGPVGLGPDNVLTVARRICTPCNEECEPNGCSVCPPDNARTVASQHGELRRGPDIMVSCDGEFIEGVCNKCGANKL